MAPTGSTAEHALVVGGASGIGRGVVRRLLARGVPTTVLDKDPEALDLDDGDHAPTALVAADVTDENMVADGFDEAERRSGTVTRLVVSAGAHGQLLDVVNLDLVGWQQLIDVHLRGTLILLQEFGRRILPATEDGRVGDASVVTLASTTGITASRKQGDYGPAKSALAQLTRVAAMEWAGSGVRANAVAAGMTLTPFVRSMVSRGYDLGASEQRTPLGRLAEVDEVASAVEYLLMDATYITGVVLPVDGGWTALGR